MEFFKKIALAALVMGFSGAALVLPNINNILKLAGPLLVVVTPHQIYTTQRVKLGAENRLMRVTAATEGHCAER